MLCQICMKYSAVYHVPKIISSQIVLMHLCKECANKTQTQELSNGFDDRIHYILEGLIRSKTEGKRPVIHLKCPVCGTTLRELRDSKPLGCPQCYETFSDYLKKEIQLKGYEFSKHRFSNRIMERINSVKKELRAAIKSENFEKAAILRDKIRQYEKENLFHEN
jgi:protein arginine kinase activator